MKTDPKTASRRKEELQKRVRAGRALRDRKRKRLQEYAFGADGNSEMKTDGVSAPAEGEEK